MNFICQKNSIEVLKQLADYDRHSIVIEGSPGCGKTYLSKYFSQLIGSDDFVVVNPTVDAIRKTIDTCYNISNKIVVCIENLDTGVFGASGAILKFLEEPLSNVYIIVTCRNIQNIPDTIPSRSTVVSVSPPHSLDIDVYGEFRNRDRFNLLKNTLIWKSVKTLSECDTILNMDKDRIEYIESLPEVVNSKDSISNKVWALGHFPDNTETPLEFVIRYIMCSYHDRRIDECCISCIHDLNYSRLASHAVLAKFLFETRYGG